MRYLEKGEIIRGSDLYKAWNGRDKHTLRWVRFDNGYKGAIGSRVGGLISKVRRHQSSASPNNESEKLLCKFESCEYQVIKNGKIYCGWKHPDWCVYAVKA